MLNTERIKGLLAENLMTQGDLANKAGITASTVSRLMLTGRASRSTVKKIARVLNIETSELIRKEG